MMNPSEEAKIPSGEASPMVVEVDLGDFCDLGDLGEAFGEKLVDDSFAGASRSAGDEDFPLVRVLGDLARLNPFHLKRREGVRRY